MTIKVPEAAIKRHLAYLNKAQLAAFRAIRRERLGKKAGARGRILELCEEVRLYDETKAQLEAHCFAPAAGD